MDSETCTQQDNETMKAFCDRVNSSIGHPIHLQLVGIVARDEIGLYDNTQHGPTIKIPDSVTHLTAYGICFDRANLKVLIEYDLEECYSHHSDGTCWNVYPITGQNKVIKKEGQDPVFTCVDPR